MKTTRGLVGLCLALAGLRAGVARGERAPITKVAGGGLGPRLLELLKDRILPDLNGKNPIEFEEDLRLEEDATELLDYFDHGLFPIVFGEHPVGSLLAEDLP